MSYAKKVFENDAHLVRIEALVDGCTVFFVHENFDNHDEYVLSCAFLDNDAVEFMNIKVCENFEDALVALFVQMHEDTLDDDQINTSASILRKRAMELINF
jgi:putative NIF3 family GTP cyclohydrolase 1 type 2